MAALNFNFLMTDTGDNGTGPYVLTAIKNPSVPASGGTAITANIPTGVTPVVNPIELLSYAEEAMINVIAAANTTDTNNS